jgi:hypothetical protein
LLIKTCGFLLLPVCNPCSRAEEQAFILSFSFPGLPVAGPVNAGLRPVRVGILLNISKGQHSSYTDFSVFFGTAISIFVARYSLLVIRFA